MLEIPEVIAFCRGRFCDVTWRTAGPDGILLEFGFEESTAFFRCYARRFEYVELAAGLSITGGIAFLSLEEAARVAKWAHLPEAFVGSALVLWESDAELARAAAPDAYVVVAERFELEAGAHWPGR